MDFLSIFFSLMHRNVFKYTLYFMEKKFLLIVPIMILDFSHFIAIGRNVSGSWKAPKIFSFLFVFSPNIQRRICGIFVWILISTFSSTGVSRVNHWRWFTEDEFIVKNYISVFLLFRVIESNSVMTNLIGLTNYVC